MDISIRDKVLDNLQVELGHRKNILRNKFVNIDELSKENTFLSGVKDDYKKHYGYIKKIKEEQYRSMGVLADYLDNLLQQTDGANESLRIVKKQQKSVISEMNKIKDEIDDIANMPNEKSIANVLDNN